jgi:hypothetical protein
MWFADYPRSFVRIPHRQVTFPEEFVKRFTDLFPDKEGAYRLVYRSLEKGNIDSVATFLHGENGKFSARQIADAIQEDGTLSGEFRSEVKRRCDIAELYNDLIRLMPSP